MAGRICAACGGWSTSRTGAEVSGGAAIWRAPGGALALLLAACQGDAAAPALEASPLVLSHPPIAAPTAGPPAADERRLCTVLTSVMASEPQGFARLRGRPLGAGQWLGRATLPGTERCTIEGEAWPGARYSCAGTAFAGARQDGARGAFEALADELDQCLQSPIWFPRSWHRGSAFEFAMDERLQAWTDYSTSPPSQIVLKVQQDGLGHAYRVKLDLQPVP
jgi:hypothetical protein